jgi:hypothetical protein
MTDYPLIEAVKKDDVSAARVLIASGANVDVHGTEQDWVPLSYAAGRGNLAMLKLLVEAGADVTAVGRDNRTPYSIAMAAGRVEVARYLAGCEERSGRVGKPRKYCRAFHLRVLHEFPDWPKNENENLDGHTVVFLHQDFMVTRSMFHGEEVIPIEASSKWRTFCHQVLKFEPPRDFELIPSAECDARDLG